MKLTRVAMTTALAVTSIALSAGAVQSAKKDLKGSIKIDGSSTVYPITEAVAEAFADVAPDVRITVGISGTGGGFKRFVIGETDISDASRPIKGKESDEAKKGNVEYIEIPVAFDGLSIVVNKSNYWCDSLTVDELKKVFLDGSTVKTWKDIRSDWPASPIKLFAPGTDSGTFDYFKEVVAGDKGAIRSDMSVSENDNILVSGVSGDEGGLGFFGCAYYFENKDKLKIVKIVNPKTGEAMEPTPQTIETGTYAPFSRPLFIYVNKASMAKPEVKAFVDFYMTNAAKMATEVGYVRLPQAIYDRAKANIAKNRIGSQYLNEKGEKVEGSILDVYK